MTISLREVDKVEILTLQDNYFDALASDNNAVVARPMPLENMEFRKSLLAEHGFSSMVKVTQSDQTGVMLFDFGFSDFGAAYNADTLGVDLTQVQLLALSHGHLDHIGGLKALASRVGKPGIELIAHPGVFRSPRYRKITEEFKITVPSLTQEAVDEAGVKVKTTEGPMAILDDKAVFLGSVARTTEFEKGSPGFFYLDDGVEKVDDFADDTALAFNVKGKGLVVLTGCAHSGIVNTVRHACEATGVSKVHAVMGGFHLSGKEFEDILQPTIQSLKAMNPDYVIPTHCTGRSSIMAFEKAMPDQFLVNMAGTTMTFAA